MSPPSAIDIQGGDQDRLVPISLHPTTVKDISVRRAKAGELVAGVAAFSTSEQFKGSVSV